MSKFKVGERVRCVNDDHTNSVLTFGQEYTVAQIDDDMIGLDGLPKPLNYWYEQRFTLSDDSASQQKGEDDVYGVEPENECSFCDTKLPMGQFTCQSCWDAGCRAVSYGLPKSSGIPETARAIMNIVPEKKVVPLTPKQEEQAQGVARAVENLYRRDDAYLPAASLWSPDHGN